MGLIRSYKSSAFCVLSVYVLSSYMNGWSLLFNLILEFDLYVSFDCLSFTLQHVIL